MKLTIAQLDAIRTAAYRAGDTDLATLAEDAKVSPTARTLVEAQHAPCAECEDPVRVKTEDQILAELAGQATDFVPGPRAHHDCDHPEQGIAGPEHGYKPSGLVLML